MDRFYQDLAEHGGPESEARWLPDEWGYSDGNDSELVKLSALLFAHDDAVESKIDEEDADERREENWRLFFAAVTSALKQLKEEKAFEAHSAEVLCFASVSDDGRAEEVENQSARQLNVPELTESFLSGISSAAFSSIKFSTMCGLYFKKITVSGQRFNTYLTG